MSSTKHREGMNQLWPLPGRHPSNYCSTLLPFILQGNLSSLSNLAQILGQVFFNQMYCLSSSSGFGLYYVTEFADFLREFILSFYLLVTEPTLTSHSWHKVLVRHLATQLYSSFLTAGYDHVISGQHDMNESAVGNFWVNFKVTPFVWYLIFPLPSC